MKPSEKSNRSTIKALVSLGLLLAVVIGASRAQAGEAPLVKANYAAFSGAFAPLSRRHCTSVPGSNCTRRCASSSGLLQAVRSRS